jgi:hypothetical protein
MRVSRVSIMLRASYYAAAEVNGVHSLFILASVIPDNDGASQWTSYS